MGRYQCRPLDNIDLTMKLLIVAVFCAVCAYVAAEQCRDTGDCSHVTCDAGHALECHLRQCTCTDSSQGTCSRASDCSGSCRHQDWHCVDGSCRCGFGIGGGGLFPGK